MESVSPGWFYPMNASSFFILQVFAKGLLYLGMNTAGLFIHYLTDHAQRQVFLETRRCIEGRLKLEQENQRQVCAGSYAASQVSRAVNNLPHCLPPGAAGAVHSASLCGLGDDRWHELPGGRAQPSWVSQDLHPPVQRRQVGIAVDFFFFSLVSCRLCR